jgi:hypothetical protein
MIWEPTREDNDSSLLQVQYGDMLGGLPVGEVVNKIYCFDRLVWFGQVLATIERASPEVRTMLWGGEHRAGIDYPVIPARLWATGARQVEKQEPLTTRFIHYGSPLEVVLGASAGVSVVSMALQRVLVLWRNLQSTRVTQMQTRLLIGYYKQVEDNGPDAFETPEDYRQFMHNLVLAERGLQGATEMNGVNLPPIGARV